MAKRSKKTRTPIQFRPGDLEDPLSEFAEAQEMSVNDAARNLVVLALNNLGCQYCDAVEELAEVMPGSASFSQACWYLAFRLQEASQLRGKQKKPPLSDAEKMQLAHDVIIGFGGSEALVEKKQQVKVHRLR